MKAASQKRKGLKRPMTYAVEVGPRNVRLGRGVEELGGVEDVVVQLEDLGQVEHRVRCKGVTRGVVREG